ncbi:MAG TPA: C25 family cysteine peptidase [Candidatus Thermoplasmatota archaeon]|nr:C25 family cysteine peptidase [Candidatus Thermoplasmatota archaeon]
MGKKIVGILVIGLVFALVFPVGSISASSTDSSIKKITTETHESTSVLFSSQPMLSEKDGFVEIQIEGATTQLLEPNKPVLPIYVRTYQIPFGATDVQVTCAVKNLGSLHLNQDVIPARIASSSSLSEQTAYVKDPVVYGSSEFYPSSWYRYDLGAGRNENDQQVTFVKVICYPVRYSPMTNEISITGGFDVTISYNEPQTPLTSSTEEYDMIIIAPEKFSSSLQSLIDFKNSKGVITKFKSVESILDEYDGYDAPEQIKYFIKNEYDTSNITYVLLVGGLKSHIFAKDKDTSSAGWTGWWVPVRYVNMPHEDDEGCLSDLYYGCLYNGTGGFDSWDSNEDGVYAAWNKPGSLKDTFDLYPEVYVSRLPCVTDREVKAVVRKILTYEGTSPDTKPWYNNFVGVGGKTGEYYLGKPDGEYLCDLAYNYTKIAIPELRLTTCYSTNRDTGGRTPISEDILKSINEGAGFVDFEGHGNPFSWNTIWFDGEYPEDWTGGFSIYSYPFVRNRDKLPVVIVGGCHNAMYNVSLIPAMLDTNRTKTRYFCYGMPVPVCFCAGLVLKNRGGAIASAGSTGYGIGYVGYAVSLSGELESNFFYEIGHGSTHVAQAHNHAIQKFLAEEEIQQTEAFVITNWALLGDPSLQFGGYS